MLQETTYEYDNLGHLWKMVDAKNQITEYNYVEAIREEPDEELIQKSPADSVLTLLTPGLALSELSESVVRMVKAMTMYCSGASLSQIGRWFGGYAKTTIYNWIMGLSLDTPPVLLRK